LGSKDPGVKSESKKAKSGVSDYRSGASSGSTKVSVIKFQLYSAAAKQRFASR